MSGSLQEKIKLQLPTIDPSDSRYVPELVESILSSARTHGVSDVHLLPSEHGLEMRWRIDGVLQVIAKFPSELSGNIVSRLKVLAELLTYRTDVPQEGRISGTDDNFEMRVSTFPTLFGEKGVVRLFVGSGKYRYLNELGFPPDISKSLKQHLSETGGIILVTGPAGSGKTTTLYACLREIFSRSAASRSIATLEDPIEAVVSGVSQSQIKPTSGFDYETALKSLLRQDPEVIMVGEIRDTISAELVFQASLTGHLVLTTFHAGSTSEAVGRLLEMGIEPYQLRSGILCVLNQRLVRRLCECSRVGDDPDGRLGLDVDQFKVSVGCEQCSGAGYRDRIVLVETMTPGRDEIGSAILARSDAAEIERCAVEAGMITRWQRGCDVVNSGTSSPKEVRRVLGFR
jgi:general secretion pathway protein E